MPRRSPVPTVRCFERIGDGAVKGKSFLRSSPFSWQFSARTYSFPSAPVKPSPLKPADLSATILSPLPVLAVNTYSPFSVLCTDLSNTPNSAGSETPGMYDLKSFIFGYPSCLS